jgi:hypothetical protein
MVPARRINLPTKAANEIRKLYHLLVNATLLSNYEIEKTIIFDVSVLITFYAMNNNNNLENYSTILGIIYISTTTPKDKYAPFMQ